MAKKAEKSTHICSECIGEFDGKEMFNALKKAIIGSDYYTIYCGKCIEKLKIKDFTPYYKSNAKSPEEKLAAKIKRDAATKTKKSTTAKTKKSTTIKKK